MAGEELLGVNAPRVGEFHLVLSRRAVCDHQVWPCPGEASQGVALGIRVPSQPHPAPRPDLLLCAREEVAVLVDSVSFLQHLLLVFAREVLELDPSLLELLDCLGEVRIVAWECQVPQLQLVLLAAELKPRVVVGVLVRVWNHRLLPVPPPPPITEDQAVR